jgi:VWFA-related protein
VLQRFCSALRLLLLLGGLANLLSASLQSQTALPDENGGRVFKANARIVVLDVVVSGKNRRPLTGLHKQDFVLSEDGHPQTITYFEEHTGAQPLPASQERPPDLRPNIFTNSPRVKPSDSVTVLVLDTLNTPTDDQATLHVQVLKYLKKVQPGNRIAIFTLGTQLRFVQGFTDDPALLAAAINNKNNGTGTQSSPLLQSSAERGGDQELVGALMEIHAVDAARAMQQFIADQSSNRSGARLRLTLTALQQLARYLAGYPGRKNVVWFSGGFPVVIFPNPGLSDSFGAQRDDQEEVRKTDALLASAQVAIYPVAAEGVATGSQYSPSTDPRLTTRSQVSRPQQEDAQEAHADHAAMDEIARDTGGVAFYNTNSLTDALDRVAGHGSNFYTLTYTSTNPSTDGQFRRIQVDLANAGGYQLAYRRGYYADDAKSVQAAAAKPPAEPLSAFLGAGLPDSTQIPLTLRVVRGSTRRAAGPALSTRNQLPASPGQGGDNPKLKGALTRYMVDLMIPASALRWDPAPNGRHRVALEAGLVVFNREGIGVNWMLRQIDLNPDAAHYAVAQTSGVNLYLEIDSPDDAVSLRGGVYDLNANLAGTLEIPLSTIVSPGPATSSK